MKFSDAEIKKAHAISEHMTKQAASFVKAAFGDVAGNPNTWTRMAYPTYGGASTVMNNFKWQPTMLGSAGRFARGAGNWVAGMGGALTVGAGGRGGVIENLAHGEGLNSFRNAWNSGTQQMSQNGVSRDLAAPATWWKAPGPLDAYREFGRHMFHGRPGMPWQTRPF
jgi:hypothetical protein